MKRRETVDGFISKKLVPIDSSIHCQEISDLDHVDERAEFYCCSNKLVHVIKEISLGNMLLESFPVNALMDRLDRSKRAIHCSSASSCRSLFCLITGLSSIVTGKQSLFLLFQQLLSPQGINPVKRTAVEKEK
jgi:hypothetical protein